jgi:hypothetical protein
MDKPAQPPSRPGAVVAWLVVSQALGLLSLLPWMMFAGFSLMAFDSESGPGWWLVGPIWGYPLLPIGTAIAAWLMLARGRIRTAVVLSSLPLLLVVPMLAYIILA